ncbi:hypothetical protein KEM55_001243 [Ascosphaera atra]|nr:hypothetical protein KEM55_001243 [Ascosphaera atra]
MFWTLVEFPVHFGYDNGGHIYDFVRPTIELTPGTKLRDNSLRLRDIQYINYAPPFQQPFQPYLDDSSTRIHFRTDLEKYHAAIRRFTEILNEPANVFTLKLRAGDCVIFDNRRVVHARNAFEMSESQAAAMQRDGKPAERWLRGTYVDSDPVKSIMRVSKREDLMGWLRQSEDPPLVGHWRKGMGDPVEHAMEQMGLKGKENAHEHGCGGCGCGH